MPATATTAAAAEQEEESEECPLAAIFYAEFDNVSGEKLVHQYPPEKFTQSHYNMLSSHIICDKGFCEKVTVVDSMAIPWTLASFPSSIEDDKVPDKYDRVVFRYNISFVFKKGHSTGPRSPYDKEPFVKVLERFGWWLREMELRFGYLYGDRSKKKVRLVRLRECLTRAYKGMKKDRRAWLMMTGPGCPSIMPLLQPYLASTPLKNWRKIQDHDVPVRRCPGMVEIVSSATSALAADPDASWSADFDLVVQQVVPHINGVKHVKKISRDSQQVEIAAVKKALQWVLYTNQILLTDVFRYCNVYVQTTKTAGKFLYTRRPDFREACWERIAKPTPVVVVAVSENASSIGEESEGRQRGGVWILSSKYDGAARIPHFEGRAGAAAAAAAAAVQASRPAGAAAAVGEFDWGGTETETGTIPDAPHPMALTRLYASFQCDRCVMDVLRIAEGPEGFVEQFDHRRMCSFGVEVGILRRLHCTPLCVRAEGKEATARRAAMRHTNYPRQSLGGRHDLEYVQKLLNGQRTEDALCCFLYCSPQELTDFAASDGSKVYRHYPF
ncbi:unnamed protein product [Pylaiella littoralis]